MLFKMSAISCGEPENEVDDDVSGGGIWHIVPLHVPPDWEQAVAGLLVDWVTQVVPFQYWPDGHVGFVGGELDAGAAEVTHALPFQYWPDGHEEYCVEDVYEPVLEAIPMQALPFQY